MKRDKCPNCGDAQKLTLTRDVGYDVYAEGEERQHLQICKCGYRRFVVDVYLFSKEPFVSYGEWYQKELK